MKSQSIIFIVLILVVFYALFIVPQRRQQKNKQKMMQKLGPGAKVLTSGGIYGQIVSVEGEVLILRIADDVEIEIDQRAVIRVVEAAASNALPDTEMDGESRFEEDKFSRFEKGDQEADSVDSEEVGSEPDEHRER